MAAAVPPDEKEGAVVSMVILRAAELDEVLPAASVAVAVIAEVPSVRGAVARTEKDQVPELLVVVEPRELPSAKSSTELLASAVPVKVGVEVLVRLSELEVPPSEVAIRSGVEGAAGGVPSMMVWAAEVKVVEPPAASVVVAMTRTSWPARDWADVSSC